MDKGLIIDTNILLEIILDQENSLISSKVLDSSIKLFVTDISLVSIFIVCKKHNVADDILELFSKMLMKRCEVLHFEVSDLIDIFRLASVKKLDFDDGHIYFYAKQNKIKIVTFDKHLLNHPNISVDAKYIL